MPDQPTIPDAAVTAFEAAVAATGCPRCGRTVPCRCHVPADERPDRTRIGLAAALPHLTPPIRAQAAAEIAKAIQTARDGVSWLTDGEAFAYDHAAGLARELRVPDCGDQYHGADGGPCGGCGFDIAEPIEETP